MGRLDDKVCLITGGARGQGAAEAARFVAEGATVYITDFRVEAGQETAASTGAVFLEHDVTDPARWAAVVAQVLADTGRIDVLVNNAGIWSERRKVSPDGVELVWATNVLGYFLVTDLLLPQLRAAGKARVVNVASQLAGDLDLSDVQLERRPWSGRLAYAQSKQADRMLTWALARRLAGTGVSANAMHPGFVATEIFGKGGGLVSLFASLYAKLRGRRPEEGADTVVWLAASPDVEGRSGLFWIDRQERRCRFRDEPGEEALWALCLDMSRPA